MDTKHALFAAVLLSTAFCVTTLWADSYRCGRKLIRTGDSASELLATCGKPLYKDRGKAFVRAAGGSQELSVQRWYYRQGSRSLGRVVLIYQGEVVGIEIE